MTVKEMVSEMTLEEKASLCSGRDFWTTKPVERLGIPSILVSDGPHGLRKQENAENGESSFGQNLPAVCFPSGAGIAASFDRKVAGALGEALGEAARAEGVHTLLGPAINIKRSPLCGRNFEYFSEDPYLTGELAAAYVQAVQSHNVGTSVKHFAANNQETNRMSISVQADERTLREIYLAGFERVIRKARPWTVMCSYNRINGVYSCENPWLLRQVLREEWGFDGIVMTDWGAMNRRREALKAGLDLEMPTSHGVTDRQLVEAVRSGTLEESELDAAVERLLRWIFKGAEKTDGYDKQAHHTRARELETECAVLLKNEGLLPLQAGLPTAFIGGFARKPRFQGGGSSHINAPMADSVLAAVEGRWDVVYCEGFSPNQEETDPEKLAEAVALARNSHTAVIFAGLPESYESEGFDRKNLDLPACQNELIRAVAAVQPRTVVVLQNGSPVAMPWISETGAVLELYLGGEAVGEAAVELLYGQANPSGKLPETFPVRLEDTPCYLDFPGERDQVHYSEGVFVGYRYYDAKKLPVLFPFGHGLSYTEFRYDGITLSTPELREDGTVQVTVTLTNVGSRRGKEAVQLYVAPPKNGSVRRPPKELKGFEKIELAPGQSGTVCFTLDQRAFSYYEEQLGGWYAEPGAYEILVGTSSETLPLRAGLTVFNNTKIPLRIQDHTTLGDIYRAGLTSPTLTETLKRTRMVSGENSLGEGTEQMADAMLQGLPLRSIRSFGGCSEDAYQIILRELSAALEGR